MSIEINSIYVVKLVSQFLKENNLTNTLKCLEEESTIKMNTVDSIEDFKNNILRGKWDLVLQAINGLNISVSKLLDLYEQIIYELLEYKENEIARGLINNDVSKYSYTKEFSMRINRLENLVNNPNVEVDQIYSQLNTNKDRCRANIAESLSKELAVMAPNRLIFLLNQGVKHLYTNKEIPPNIEKYDIFTGRIDMILKNESNYVKNIYKEIKFENSHIETAKFSPDGNYLATGSSDGFIEIWDPQTGKLKTELEYQLENVLMLHTNSVTSVNFSKDSKMLCSGDLEGNVKLFKLSNGKCLREFNSAHSKGVTCLIFSKDSSIIISGSFDAKIKFLGLKTGKVLKELTGHTSFINDLVSNWEFDRFYSASSDGKVNLWSYKSQDLIYTITPPLVSYMLELSVNNIVVNPKNPDQVFICNRSNTIYLMTSNGLVVKSFCTQKDKQIVYCTVSYDGEWLYIVDEDNILYSYGIEANVMRNMFHIHEKDVISLIHHPNMSMVVSYALDGKLNIYI
jgi:WD40 repeat-containing protein SMU1